MTRGNPVGTYGSKVHKFSSFAIEGAYRANWESDGWPEGIFVNKDKLRFPWAGGYLLQRRPR